MKQETLAIHDGSERGLTAHTPIHRNTAYHFKSTQHAADLFGLKELGSIYTRIDNPSNEALERRLASLEGGNAALTLASGTAAIFYSIINLCQAGDEFIASSDLYGGTVTMFNSILPQLGITVKTFNINRPEEIKELVNEKTRLIFTETIGNPSLNFVDFDQLREYAQKYHLPLVVDSTFTPPPLFRPLEHGGDVVIHSLSKWYSGQGVVIGGGVIDKGEFDYTDSKFTLYNEPDKGYHDLRWAHDLGDLSALAFILRMRLVPLRNLGACLSPDNAWTITTASETLPLRIQRHSENALAVAENLSRHPKVEWIRYPGLLGDPSYKTASRFLKNGFGGMIVIGLKGGREAGEKFINHLNLTSTMANVGDSRTLAIHPASTTHSQLSDQQLRDSKTSPELVRLSIGLEHVSDIISDFEQALEKV